MAIRGSDLTDIRGEGVACHLEYKKNITEQLTRSKKKGTLLRVTALRNKLSKNTTFKDRM